MFKNLQPQPADPLLALIDIQRADTRSGKIDLGVGVYKDASGATPVMRAVKAAERRLLEAQQTKAYVGPSGDVPFIDLGRKLVFGEGADRPIAGMQTPGGTAALRLAADLLVRAGVKAIWVGRPTWANHDAILAGAGVVIREYAYFDGRTQTVLFDQMCDALRDAQAGDAVLLQAACHNPIGADLSGEQWKEVARIVGDRGLVPVIDIAYQGLAYSIGEDVAGALKVVDAASEALVAVSMSKNFGLYRERTGALYAVSRSSETRALSHSNMLAIARANYSMPPDHGAAVVRLILEDPTLTADWLEELGEMRSRIREIRLALADYGVVAGIDLAPLARQNGMFSLLPLSRSQIDALRVEHAIYMTGFGRVNLAGLTREDVPRLVASLGALRSSD